MIIMIINADKISIDKFRRTKVSKEADIRVTPVVIYSKIPVIVILKIIAPTSDRNGSANVVHLFTRLTLYDCL